MTDADINVSAWARHDDVITMTRDGTTVRLVRQYERFFYRTPDDHTSWTFATVEHAIAETQLREALLVQHGWRQVPFGYRQPNDPTTSMHPAPLSVDTRW